MSDLLTKMRNDIAGWDEEEDREDWWNWQRRHVEAADHIESLATENTALRSLCAKLAGALEPFARIGGYMRHTPESRSASVVYNAVEADGLNSRGTAAATVGDFRTALTALARSKELLP